MRISIIVAVYNREGFIKECLGSLLKQAKSDFEIIVIDDGSCDRTSEILRQYQDPRLRVFRNEKNRGLAYSRNQGVLEARAAVVAFIDSDCTAHPDWAENLLRPFDGDQEVMMVGGRVDDPLPKTYWEFVNKGNDFIAAQSGYVQRIVGCNMAFRKDFLREHPFDETARYPAADELDLCLRCEKRKKKIYYAHDAVVCHYHRSSMVSTILQQFHYGFENARIRIRHRVFPYLSYGGWSILFMITSFLIGLAGFPLFSVISFVFFIIYCILISCVIFVLKRRAFWAGIAAFPGEIVACLANSAGSLYSVWALNAGWNNDQRT